MKTKSGWFLVLVLWAWVSLADPSVRPFYSVMSSGRKPARSDRSESVLRLLSHPDMYSRFTYRGSNWIVQYHEWSTNLPNHSSIYRVHTRFEFARTNIDIPVARWSSDSAEVSGPLWDHGRISFLDDSGDFVWLRCQTTLRAYPDPANPAAEARLLMGYSPLRYWSTDHQAPLVYGRFHFPSNSLPVAFTIDPIVYDDARCAPIWRPGIAQPDYWQWAVRSWTDSFVCPESPLAVTMAAPSIPGVDGSAPPLPEDVPSPLVLKFTNQVQSAPAPRAEGSAGRRSVFKAFAPPPLPPTGSGFRPIDESRPEGDWAGSLLSAESWTKIIEFDGRNPHSAFLFFVSSNLADWTISGLAENVEGRHYRFTDTNASSGVRFYKIMPID